MPMNRWACALVVLTTLSRAYGGSTASETLTGQLIDFETRSTSGGGPKELLARSRLAGTYTGAGVKQGAQGAIQGGLTARRAGYATRARAAANAKVEVRPCQYDSDVMSFYGGHCNMNMTWAAYAADTELSTFYTHYFANLAEADAVCGEVDLQQGANTTDLGPFHVTGAGVQACITLPGYACSVRFGNDGMVCASDYGKNGTLEWPQMAPGCDGSPFSDMFECTLLSSDDGQCQSRPQCMSVRDAVVDYKGPTQNLDQWRNATGGDLTGILRYGLCLPRVFEPLLADQETGEPLHPDDQMLMAEQLNEFLTFYPGDLFAILAGNETAEQLFGNCTFGQYAAFTSNAYLVCTFANDLDLGLLNAVNGTLNATRTAACLAATSEGVPVCHVARWGQLGPNEEGEEQYEHASCVLSPTIDLLPWLGQDDTIASAVDVCYDPSTSFNQTACTTASIWAMDSGRLR